MFRDEKVARVYFRKIGYGHRFQNPVYLLTIEFIHSFWFISSMSPGSF